MAHKHTYCAPGGVGIVVGARTKKLLYIGVKVKTCRVCTTADIKQKPPKAHDCGKNWSGSSQAMEAAIFLEAFSECESVHGVRYMRFIGDGDSNTMARLLTEGPHWCKYITKIECANHACKCLRGSLERLVEDNPHYKGRQGLSKVKRVKITAGVRCAIKMRSREVEKIGKHKAVQKLKADIQNAPWHVFGHHSNCSKDFCLAKKSGADTGKSGTDTSRSGSHTNTPCTDTNSSGTDANNSQCDVDTTNEHDQGKYQPWFAF